MSISDALGNLINSWGWLLVVGVFFGGGDILARILDSRRKVTKAIAQRDAARTQLKATEAILGKVMDGKAPVQAVTVMHLLRRVRDVDTVYPQLPIDLRAEIDTALTDYTQGDMIHD